MLILLPGHALVAGNWPHWRGPSRNGVSTDTGLPVSWGATCLSEASTPPPPAAAPGGPGGFGRGGRGRGGFGGFGQARPITPLGCSEFETTNIAWRLPLPAY
ncbi:MAG TPA: hypothetical protein VFO58_07915, partial [Vicinamibacterales bacterium]|nr:hypothetical protein [Vicinamibacterales bacterium]